MTESHKANALDAISRVEKILAQPEFSALDRIIVGAILGTVREQIEQIQEVKRQRKAKGAP